MCVQGTKNNMKINKIKQIDIGDSTFEIIWDNNDNGGYFHMHDCIIKIGCKDCAEQPAVTLNIIIHELKEIIQTFQCTRYSRPDEVKAFEFHYTHKEHTDLCYRLAGLLSKFIK